MANTGGITKRLYSTEALEFWLDRMSSDWENQFHFYALAGGRQIYREGGVHTIELNQDYAIVHVRCKEPDVYVVLEWEGDQLAFRGSILQHDKVRSLAVAGLYEIEELLADEIGALSPEVKADKKKPKEPFHNDVQVEDLITKKSEVDPLSLHFLINEEGLFVEPLRKGAARGCRSSMQTLKEREQRIRLANLAHKSKFQFRPAANTYVLHDPKHIARFIKSELSHWERYFKIEKSRVLERLKRGVQVLTVVARAKEEAGGHLRLEWGLKLGKRWLTQEQSRFLLSRAGKGPTLVPDLGLLEIPADKAAILSEWDHNIAYEKYEHLPRYIFFSLFEQGLIPFERSPEFVQWRDSLSRPPALEEDKLLPSFLRPYQKEGVLWVHHLLEHNCHALLADEMGLGKTLQVLSLLATWKIPEKPQLIVCPASVVPVWKNEIQKFFPDMPIKELKRGYDFCSHPDSCVWIASYTQLRRHKALLSRVDFGYAILDEAQFIKNPDAKVTLACFSIRAAHRIVLTGTPLENRHLDLWTLFRFLMPGLLGSRQYFEWMCVQDEVALTAQLRRQVAPFVLRRKKGEVVKELPQKVEMNLVCPLSAVQQYEYSNLVEKALSDFGNDLNTVLRERPMHLFTLLLRLRQTCCDPDLLPWRSADLKQSGKIMVLLDKVSSILKNDRKVVIFSQFVTLLQRVRRALAERFPGVLIHELTGSTLDREEPISAFQRSRGKGVMLVSLRSGGTGITLHAADYVFLVDPWWNPAVEDQAIDRVHRIGQKNTVFVYRMITSGTVEERMQKLKAKKRKIFDDLVGELGEMGALRGAFQSLSDLVALEKRGEGPMVSQV